MVKEEMKKAILDTIDQGREEIVAFLQELISFPSVTGEEKWIQEFIASRLSEMGLEIDVWEPDWEQLKKHPGYVQVDQGYEGRPNVVGVLKGRGGRSLLLNGHVDVIPANPSAWKHDPWRGEIVGDRLYGRGASDMKSGLAAMTMALDCLLKAGIRPKGDIILEYVVDEERSGHGTLACVLKGYRADAGICCESSDLNIQPACIGRIWFEIIVKGKPAGIARRWEGVDAIEKGYKVTQAILDLEKIRINELKHPLYPDNRGALPCSVGVFDAGEFPSSLADRCVLRGSMATLPGEDSEEAKKQLVEQVQNMAKTDPWLRNNPPEVRFKGYFAEPAEIPADHPICRTLATAFKDVTGKEAMVSGREGAADTRFLIKYGMTPTVIFGPGKTAQMHATDEWVSIEDVITAVKTIALTMADWCC
ncbi:MAG: ArgE/DapE family deacylase [Candidatus Hadarchaeum sp.]|uniref:ArgE/DapE family deacylase n=3 Tax=Candidatus Hadarchaeum sp. TaxID=2883567 RepID=UPI00317F25C1